MNSVLSLKVKLGEAVDELTATKQELASAHELIAALSVAKATLIEEAKANVADSVQARAEINDRIGRVEDVMVKTRTAPFVYGYLSLSLSLPPPPPLATMHVVLPSLCHLQPLHICAPLATTALRESGLTNVAALDARFAGFNRWCLFEDAHNPLIL
jgi:hypothetical protein